VWGSFGDQLVFLERVLKATTKNV